MADEKIIFSMVGVSKTFTNQKKVLNNIYLSFFYGAKIGIIGLNGSGKSTLMKIIAGIDKNYQGEVVFAPGYSVGYLEQEPQLDDTKTVKEVVEEGCAATVALLKEYEDINMKLCEPMSDDEMNRLIERQGELYEQIDHVNGWELDSVLERAMDALRCPDPDQSVKVLSGGERRRVALCRLLLQQPDVLLLDEPTNHLDAESIDWLEQHLQQYKGTVIAVTHDRYFLDNVAGWILELDRGEGIPWKGNYSGWLDQKTKRLAMEEKHLVVLMPYAGLIPMPTIAAILFMVAYNMSEWKKFVHLCKTAPKSDIIVLVLTFVLTVMFDLVVAIEVGMVLAAMLFMKRMSEVTEVEGWKYIDDENDPDSITLRVVPKNTLVYEISGPLFFGAADKILNISLKDKEHILILRMRSVTALDATAMHALEELHTKCKKKNVTLVLSHVNEQPMRTMKKAGFDKLVGEENFCKHIDEALKRAEELQ